MSDYTEVLVATIPSDGTIPIRLGLLTYTSFNEPHII